MPTSERGKNDPLKMADEEIRRWLYLADRVKQGDELGDVDWWVIHRFLSNAAGWAKFAAQHTRTARTTV